MKTLSIALSAASVALAGCSFPAMQQQQASGADAPGHYDQLVISGSFTNTDELIKLNIATGAAAINCCGNFNFQPVTDPAPLPAGAYHLVGWSVVTGDGGVRWAAYRFDKNTGRAWALMQDPNNQYRWQAMGN